MFVIITHLHGLTSLRMLDLEGTKVTDAGVAELEKALPNCEIIQFDYR
ncbi:MAG TPA: leucine-rich repeat domain-containing protein [Pirellulales bacterium]|nr:leucine-rich repeat domain-containing protein [Pirellulales bacterium]